MDLSPAELNKWVEFLWGASWKILIVFCVIVYRDLVTHIGKTIIDTLASWVKRSHLK